jgi:hypothetical protein
MTELHLKKLAQKSDPQTQLCLNMQIQNSACYVFLLHMEPVVLVES